MTSMNLMRTPDGVPKAITVKDEVLYLVEYELGDGHKYIGRYACWGPYVLYTRVNSDDRSCEATPLVNDDEGGVDTE